MPVRARGHSAWGPGCWLSSCLVCPVTWAGGCAGPSVHLTVAREFTSTGAAMCPYVHTRSLQM